MLPCSIDNVDTFIQFQTAVHTITQEASCADDLRALLAADPQLSAAFQRVMQVRRVEA